MEDKDNKNALLQYSQNKRKIQIEDVQLYTSKRFLMVVLIFFGYMNMTIVRANFNMAVVVMTSKTQNTIINETNSNNAEFNWSSNEIGFILSLVYYGNIFAPLGGIIASRFGGAKMFGIGIASSAFITLLTPFLIRFNFTLFCVCRFLLGLFHILSMSGVPEIWSRWAPPNERSVLTCLSGAGWHFGLLITYPVAGFIAKTYSWPVIFYATGGLPLVWYIFWFVLVSNDPAEDKYISEAERLYLKEIINRKLNDKVVYSWKNIFTCKAVWAFCIAKFTVSSGTTAIITNLPQFVKDASNVDIKTVGMISGTPHFGTIFGLISSSYVADYLRNSKILSPTQVHKLYICVGGVLAAILFSVTSFLNFAESMVCISLHRYFISFSDVALGVVILDIAPRYASLISGIGSCFTFVAATSSPTFVGYIVTTHRMSEWNLCFVTFSIIYLFGAVFFLLFGSGEFQSWSLPLEEKQEKKNNIANQITKMS